ncbi:uncharacterized protein LOC108048998 [Drosophila rhopaloa]|uniref:Uncharacterized protein LOC108048998 n=1 Tax=Drosophila rhopaloa TaxID=1041015 RepID=A0A6P4FJI0_DRORH|nr:uncharacterized protein LOC108048998 [Drosophila rhopaloa]
MKKNVGVYKDQLIRHDCQSDVEGSLGKEESEGDEEAEAEEQPTVIEEIPWSVMKHEMDAMNRKLDEMDARFSIDPFGGGSRATREREAQMGLGPEDSRWMILNGSKDPAVRELQLNNLRIRRQLEGLIRCSELGNGRLLALDRLFSRQKDLLVTSRQEHERVLSFHLTKQLEAGKCLQRYRYAVQLYANWRELFKMGRNLREAYKKILARTQSRMDYVELKKRAIEEIAAAHEICLGSMRLLLNRVREVEVGLAPLGIVSQPNIGRSIS